MQHHVFRGDAGAKLTLNRDAHIVHFLGHQRLGRQYMLYLTGTNTVGQAGQGTVGGGVGVPTDDGHAGHHSTLFRRHHMHNALAHIANPEFGDPEFTGIVLQGLHLNPRGVIGDVGGTLERRCRHVVINGGHTGTGPPRLTARQTQAFKRLGRGHLMDDLAINIDQRRAIFALGNEVGFPQFVIEGLACHAFLLNRSVVPQRIVTTMAGLSLVINVELRHQ